jgi:hypothetical protein
VTLRALPTIERRSASLRAAALPGRYLRELALLEVGPDVQRLDAGADERLVVLLSGTHDLAAGGGTWGSRGMRATPYAGRPCGLFVPPGAPLAARGGPGELLIVAARPPQATPEQAPGTRPLLPLAGSNKVFDAASGGWQRLEDLPDTPEALLPRRIARVEHGGCTLEAVFPPEYKARVASLAETVLPPGLAWTAPARPAHAVEELLYLRTDGAVEVEADNVRRTIEREGLVWIAGSERPRLRASAACYIALVDAGPKGTT